MLPDNGKRVKQHNNYHMTKEEVRIILNYVRTRHSLKWYSFILLLLFRGMRPQEALAINVLDFDNSNFTKLSWREAKTNKLRHKEYIPKPIASILRTYCVLNRFRLKDGYLFPYYIKRSQGRPFMSSQIAASWFGSKVRKPLIKKYPEFNDQYEIKGPAQTKFRVSLYSFRRFFETYIYINNNFNVALLKELMEYNSKFDPIKHYVKVCHKEQEKAKVLERTFNKLAKELGIYGE